ncbi:MAG TPA: nucleic acid-binding protein, partial [Methanoregulaceae archaeon]|nr:nucleic acid-binding protein [Methanoregulaceae archaeon]
MAAPERPSFARREGTFEREPARRVFAGELRETRIHFREGEDEKSPTYVLLPTGERCNRVFLVGTLTEKKKQGEQNMFYR